MLHVTLSAANFPAESPLFDILLYSEAQLPYLKD